MTDIQHKPQDMTLFGIETSIVELLAFRDDIEADPHMTPAEIAESLKACDEQIQAFLSRELVKVDGVAHVLMEMQERAEVAKRERDRLSERARTWQKRHDWLEQRVIEALQFRLQATGQKKLEGEISTLKLAKNPPSVEVRQPDMVPTDMQRRTVTMPERVYQTILDGPMGTLLLMAQCKEPEPVKADIAIALKAGAGVPGCELITDKVRLVVE